MDGLDRARGAIRVVNKLITAVLSLALALLMAMAAYALWDAYLVMKNAGVSNEILHFQPLFDPTKADNPSLLELAAINPEVVAWVTIQGTNINYPVLHGPDNTKYLNRDVYGEYSLSGSVFLDHRCNGAFTDSYSLLYGHNMDGGLMLADVKQYEEKAFLEAHPTGYLFLPAKTFRLEIFAYLQVDAYQTPMFSMIEGENGYKERLAYIQDNALHYLDIQVTESQQILALSTCTSADNNDRSIVIARMVEQEPQGGVENHEENL